MSEMIDNYRQLFIAQTPMLDLRAPIEFARGAFSHAINLPLMDDQERAMVGTCYKQQGQQAAITLGHQLVSGLSKQRKLARWQAFFQQHSDGVLYCFRGGLRSKTVQHWLQELGVTVPRVQGGYKALRNFLLNELEQIAKHPLYLLAGCTGSGKTQLLAQSPFSLDLEAAAMHRGSSFGALVQPAANQINFENALAVQYVRQQHQSCEQALVLEDEGRLIGCVHLPMSLIQAMQGASVVVVEQAFEVRLARLFDEYVLQMYQQFCTRDGEQVGTQAFADYLRQGLYKVRKRLGSARYLQLQQVQEQALTHQSQDNMRAHLNWLAPLLAEYYDPMYRYQLSQKQQRIVFQGNAGDCIAYLAEQTCG